MEKNKKSTVFNIAAGLIGNAVEHHDKAIFALLAPFIGPLFFSATDPITALINTYSILFIGMFARPFGAIAYGYVADTYGRKKALYWSLSGMSIATGAMGFLPTYEQAGLYAPIALTVTRLMQHFFSAGETNGAAIFVLEHAKEKDKPILCSLVETSTMVGILLASAETVVFSYFGILTTHWRWLMWIGCGVGLAGLLMRSYCSETQAFQEMQKPQTKLNIRQFAKDLMHNRRSISAITLAAGFSCAMYVMPLPFMTAFLTIISPMTAKELTSFTTGLMLLDTLLLPVFGYLAAKVSKEKVMFTAAWLTAIISVPLFSLLEGGSLINAIVVRSLLVIIGVSFAAPFRLWAKELVPIEQRCTVVNFGCALAHILIEGPATIISLWLYKITGATGAAGIYLAFTALLAVWALRFAVPVPIKKLSKA